MSCADHLAFIKHWLRQSTAGLAADAEDVVQGVRGLSRVKVGPHVLSGRDVIAAPPPTSLPGRLCQLWRAAAQP
jgi:hypothetical protein